MTTEPTMNPEANTDDVGVKMTIEEAMILEAVQRVTTNPSAAAPVAAKSSPVFKSPTADGLGGARRNDIDMIPDTPVQLTVELGRTKVPIKSLLQLAQGSVTELNVLAGESMDVLVNGYPIAQGEVVVVNEKFGIRLTDITTPSGRIRRSNR